MRVTINQRGISTLVLMVCHPRVVYKKNLQKLPGKESHVYLKHYGAIYGKAIYMVYNVRYGNLIPAHLKRHVNIKDLFMACYKCSLSNRKVQIEGIMYYAGHKVKLQTCSSKSWAQIVWGIMCIKTLMMHNIYRLHPPSMIFISLVNT